MHACAGGQCQAGAAPGGSNLMRGSAAVRAGCVAAGVYRCLASWCMCMLGARKVAEPRLLSAQPAMSGSSCQYRAFACAPAHLQTPGAEMHMHARKRTRPCTNQHILCWCTRCACAAARQGQGRPAVQDRLGGGGCATCRAGAIVLSGMTALCHPSSAICL